MNTFAPAFPTGPSSGQIIAALGYTPSNSADEGQPNGIATLDALGKVPVSQLPAAVLGALSYQSAWNANTNSPPLTSSTGTKGYYYVVSVAGTTNLDGITDWSVGDWAVFNGSIWEQVDNQTIHNLLMGLQGGEANEYYHLKSSAYNFLKDSDQDVKIASDVAFGIVSTNTINERTTDAGVTIEAVPVKDGLVDGRNIADDGSKLDTIETGAQVNTVNSVAGKIGNVTLVAADIGNFSTAVSANADVAANTAARHAAVTLGTANGLSLSDQVLSLGFATGLVAGALSATDWNTFNDKINLTSLSGGNGIAYNNTTGVFDVDFNSTNLRITSNQIDTIQGISTTASPTFAGLTISGTISTDRIKPRVALTGLAITDFGGTEKLAYKTQDGGLSFGFKQSGNWFFGDITISPSSSIMTGARSTTTGELITLVNTYALNTSPVLKVFQLGSASYAASFESNQNFTTVEIKNSHVSGAACLNLTGSGKLASNGDIVIAGIGAPVADATSLDDVVAQFNTYLARARAKTPSINT